MGMLCPIDGTYQAIVQNITTHQQQTNQRSKDVIGYRLACGHDIYGDEAKAYQEEVAKINAESKAKEQALEAERRDKLAKAYVAVKAKVSGGKK